jgi:putative Holliday junction resolvase
MRCLGLDVGDKRIGVALCDPLGILASPLTIIDRQDDSVAVEAIVRIIDQKGVELIIVGLPVTMDGGIGAQAEKVNTFAHTLRNSTKIPMEFIDERLSTFSAKQLIREAGSRKRRGKKPDDAIAAAIILQRYLEEGL